MGDSPQSHKELNTTEDSTQNNTLPWSELQREMRTVPPERAGAEQGPGMGWVPSAESLCWKEHREPGGSCRV